MKKPMAICLEDLETANAAERYLCCAVKVGLRPGLSVDNRGTTRWLIEGEVAFQLFVTADDRLALYRAAGGAAVQVRRAGRTLDAPCEKPVILRHEDELLIAGRRFRVHTHGRIAKAFAPYYFKEHLRSAGRVAAAFALGATLSATAGGVGCSGDKPDYPGDSDPNDSDSNDSDHEDTDTIYVTDDPPDTDGDVDGDSDADTDADTDPDAGTDVDGGMDASVDVDAAAD